MCTTHRTSKSYFLVDPVFFDNPFALFNQTIQCTHIVVIGRSGGELKMSMLDSFFSKGAFKGSKWYLISTEFSRNIIWLFHFSSFSHCLYLDFSYSC